MPHAISHQAELLRQVLGGAELVVVDVGAANGVLPHFRAVQEVAKFYLFEPERTAYEKLVAQLGATHPKTRVINAALAGSRGDKTLHVTNKPTGSSLLPVRPEATDYTPSGYFFPMRTVQLHTERLGDIFDQVGEPHLHMMKIDVQGGEFEVLQGLDAGRANRLLSVQVEVGMPGAYEGQPSIAMIDEWMTQRGMVLFDLVPARARLTLDDDTHKYHTKVFRTYRCDPSVRGRVWEAELFYFRREDLVLELRDAEEVRRLCAAYAIHGFFAHAHRLAERAGKAGIFTAADVQDVIVRWHAATLDRTIAGRMKRGLKRVAHSAIAPDQMTRLAARLSRLRIWSAE